MQPNIDPAAEATTDAKTNGSPLDATADPHATGNGAVPELHELLAALQAMPVGDFSVRMAGDQTGIAGKIADTFNEIVAANAAHGAAARARRPGRRPRGQDAPARPLRH